MTGAVPEPHRPSQAVHCIEAWSDGGYAIDGARKEA